MFYVGRESKDPDEMCKTNHGIMVPGPGLSITDRMCLTCLLLEVAGRDTGRVPYS